jgi:hypothetical protein
MRILIEIIGWYGALAILLAYTLVSFEIIHSQSIEYQMLNFTGALGIFAVSFQKKVYQAATLNIVWALIALIALISILR